MSHWSIPSGGHLGSRHDKALALWGQGWSLAAVKKQWLGMVACAFHMSILEAEAGGSLCIQDQPGLYNEFQDSRATYSETFPLTDAL